MNLKLLQFIGFLLGLFLTLSFFSLSNNFTFKNTIKTIEKFDSSAPPASSSAPTASSSAPTASSSAPTASTSAPTASSSAPTASSSAPTTSSSAPTVSSSAPVSSLNIMPKNNYKFMLLSTYKDSAISNSEQKWYENDVNYKNLLSTDYNNGKYFIYNNPIELNNNTITGVNGANINKVQLIGPNALYFANNYNSNNYDLTSFTIIFMLKIKNFTNNVMLFEMLANTSVIDINNDEPKYIANSISIYLIIRSDNNYNIEITLGNSKYIILNIDKKLLIGADVNLISLIFDGLNLTFILNNNTYSIKYTNTQLITLGSSPIIINRDGDLNAVLYSFIFYKIALTLEDIVQYKKYNNYYIYGVNYVDNLKNKTDMLLVEATDNSTLKDKHIAELLEQLNKCSNNNALLMNDTLSSSLNNLHNLFPPLPTLL